MKKLFLALIAIVLVSCVTEIESHISESGETFYAQIEQETGSKTIMDEHNNIRWIYKDQVVAFMKRSFGDKYEINNSYVGKTSGYFSKVASSASGGLAAGNELDHNIVYYPYSETVECEKYGSDYILKVVLPSVQKYAKDSFGNGTFPMVAVSEDNDITFRNICGGVKLQLKGSQAVSSIKIEGNKNEILSGAASVRAYTDDSKPSIVMDSEAATYVKLVCGEGVQLRQDIATEFIIALPPVEFTKGFKITLESTSGHMGIIETDKSNTVYRSSLLAMPEVDVVMNSIPNNQIWYTATEKITLQGSMGERTITSHEFNTDTQKGIITFDGDLTEIGARAFYHCSALTSINIPDGITTIGDNAFYRCSSLTSINIPEGVTEIEEGAFSGCISLTNITIPASVTRIGADAFRGCISLVEVTINGELESYENIFSGCDKLEKIYSSISTLDNRFMIKDGSIIAVASCGMTELSIPEGVTTIGDYVFDGCSSLTKITIPESVTTIGNYAFSQCLALTDINIPKSVTEIGDNAFYWCSALTNINLPNSITTIGDNAFYWCIALTNINLPNSITTIGDNAFYRCSSLTSINIPDGVTEIGEGAFLYCFSLTNINIPESVTEIGVGAFNFCTSLVEVTINGELESYENMFWGCDKLEKIYSSISTSDNRFMVKDGKIIAVASCGMTELSIPEGVTTIGDYVFDGCSGLTKITIPESVTTIGNYAFSGCSSLTSINIPEGVTTIGDYVFYGCSGLTKITIPESVTTIGNYAFSECSSLTSINIPEGVTTIGNYAFSGCLSLTSINIPEGVTTIGDNAFNRCSFLTSINIPDGVTEIGDNAFNWCSALTNINLPNSITEIGDKAFRECRALTSINIPNSVTEIGYEAFSRCRELKNIYVKAATPPTLGESVFSNVPLESIYVPSGYESTYQNTEGWNEYASYIKGYEY